MSFKILCVLGLLMGEVLAMNDAGPIDNEKKGSQGNLTEINNKGKQKMLYDSDLPSSSLSGLSLDQTKIKNKGKQRMLCDSDSSSSSSSSLSLDQTKIKNKGKQRMLYDSDSSSSLSLDQNINEAQIKADEEFARKLQQEEFEEKKIRDLIHGLQISKFNIEIDQDSDTENELSVEDRNKIKQLYEEGKFLRKNYKNKEELTLWVEKANKAFLDLPEDVGEDDRDIDRLREQFGLINRLISSLNLVDNAKIKKNKGKQPGKSKLAIIENINQLSEKDRKKINQLRKEGKFLRKNYKNKEELTLWVEKANKVLLDLPEDMDKDNRDIDRLREQVGLINGLINSLESTDRVGIKKDKGKQPADSKFAIIENINRLQLAGELLVSSFFDGENSSRIELISWSEEVREVLDSLSEKYDEDNIDVKNLKDQYVLVNELLFS